MTRNLLCPETEEPCERGCKISNCRLVAEATARQAEADARKAAAEWEEEGPDRKFCASQILLIRGIAHPTKAQIAELANRPDVIALVKRQRATLIPPDVWKRAREIAAKGDYAGFADVVRELGEEGGDELRLCATPSEQNQIDNICAKARRQCGE